MAEQVAPDTGHPPMEWTRVSATPASGPAAARQPRAWPGRPGLGRRGRPGCLRGLRSAPLGWCRARRWKASCDSFAVMSAPPGLWSLTRLSKPLVNALFLEVREDVGCALPVGG